MNRKTFITVTAFVAFAVALFALCAPAALVAGKGVAANPGTSIWVREVGVLLVALGVMALLLRGEPGSPALRAFLIGNALVHVGLFPIELFAYRADVVTRLSGIVPNSILHVVLASGFVYFAATMRTGH